MERDRQGEDSVREWKNVNMKPKQADGKNVGLRAHTHTHTHTHTVPVPLEEYVSL